MITHSNQIKIELIKKIQTEFQNIPFPSSNSKSLSQAEAWDNYSVCDQSKDFKGKWQDIPLDDFKKNQWAIPHLDPTSFIYYLPAIMVALLNNQDIGSILTDSFFNAINNRIENPQLSLLNTVQLNLVNEFIKINIKTI